MTPLPYLAAHKVSGPDAGGFLHGQLAADTAALTGGQARFAAYCSPRGQVIALLLVCCEGPDWYFISHASLADPVAARLQMYVLRAKVQIEAQPGLRVAGLRADEAGPPGASVFEPGRPELRYALTAPAAAEDAAQSRWRREEILRHVIWLQEGTTERFLPQMLGLENIGAVSFAKGCYPGQEIVARARYLGKLKRKPVLVEVDGVVSVNPGSNCVLVSAGENIDGVVVDTVQTDQSSSVVLSVAPLEAGHPLNAFEYDGESRPARRIQAITSS